VDTWGTSARPRILKEEVDFSGKPVFQFSKGEVHLFNDRHENKVQYPFDWHRSALATITERPDNTKLSWFKKWLGGLLCVSPDPRRMSALAQKETPFPRADLSNFAEWYRHLRLESDDGPLLDDLRNAVEGFESMDLKDAGLGNRVLKIRPSFGERQDAARPHDYCFFGFDELSDGQRVLIGLYTVLHFALKPGATICFDEPDNFIALREVQPWLNKVLDRVEDDDSLAQVLIVSHHPELLNRMAFQNGLLFDRPSGRHTRVRQFDDPLQTGLSPAELVARGWNHE
jgi:predicted ATPase